MTLHCETINGEIQRRVAAEFVHLYRGMGPQGSSQVSTRLWGATAAASELLVSSSLSSVPPHTQDQGPRRDAV